MIGVFPDPYPDEALFSVVLRGSMRLGISPSDLAKEFLGGEFPEVPIDFPHGIDALIRSLSPASVYDADRIIQGHTSYPIFARFLSVERAGRVRNDLRRNGSAAASWRTGLSCCGVHQPAFLRFCPHCDEDDRRRHGERYWRRLHQFVGVVACPEHCVLLEDSAVARSRFTRWLGIPLDPDRPRGDKARVRSLDLSNPHESAWLRVAASVAQLFANEGSPSGSSGQIDYRARLEAHGWVSPTSGKVDWFPLRTAFLRYFGRDYLSDIGCAPKEPWDWLTAIIRRPERAQHPIRHSLLLEFLGRTAEDYGVHSDWTGQANELPWKCPNPPCPRSAEATLVRFRTVNRGKGRGLAALISCAHCGFVCTVPILRGALLGRVSFVRDYGWLWKKELKRMWKDLSRGLAAVARALGVCPGTVIRYAKDLGLEFPRRGPRVVSRAIAGHTRGDRLGSARNAPNQSDRRMWSSIVAESGNLGIARLAALHSALFARLRKHDRSWLRKHQPERISNKNMVLKADWNARDRALVAEVRETAASLYEDCAAKPRLVSRSLILRQMPHGSMLSKQSSRLPKAMEELRSTAEDGAAHAVRKIAWAIGQLRSPTFPERHCRDAWRLCRLAGVSGRIRDHPAVRAAIEAALR